MMKILIHHQWVHLYLLYAGAWALFHVWYFLLRPAGPRAPAERHEQGRSTNEVSF
jgi:hypothetical protein